MTAMTVLIGLDGAIGSFAPLKLAARLVEFIQDKLGVHVPRAHLVRLLVDAFEHTDTLREGILSVFDDLRAIQRRGGVARVGVLTRETRVWTELVVEALETWMQSHGDTAAAYSLLSLGGAKRMVVPRMFSFAITRDERHAWDPDRGTPVISNVFPTDRVLIFGVAPPEHIAHDPALHTVHAPAKPWVGTMAPETLHALVRRNILAHLPSRVADPRRPWMQDFDRCARKVCCRS